MITITISIANGNVRWVQNPTKIRIVNGGFKIIIKILTKMVTIGISIAIGNVGWDSQCHLLASVATQGNWVTVIATNIFTMFTLYLQLSPIYHQ